MKSDIIKIILAAILLGIAMVAQHFSEWSTMVFFSASAANALWNGDKI